MSMNHLSIGLMAVLSITTVARESAGQEATRSVSGERSYFQREANRTSLCDQIVEADLRGDCQDSFLRSDKKIWNECFHQCGSQPLWSVYAGTVILRRDSPDVAAPFGLGALGLDAPAFHVGTRAGVDIDLRRRLGECHELQFRYFGVDGWSDQQAASGATLLTNWDTFAGYSTRLHSTELNCRSKWNDSVTLLGGFRWVELHEQVDYRVDTVTTIPGIIFPFPFLPPIPPISIPADYAQEARTQNHMYGFQIGTDVLLWDRGGPLTVNTDLKTGVYSNLAKNKGSLETPLGDTVADGRTHHTAFLGELGINAGYKLTRSLALRAGYQLLWVEGVALVNENQFNALVAGDVDTGGSPFYHGAIVGAELRW
jgi:hypothetical protein